MNTDNLIPREIIAKNVDRVVIRGDRALVNADNLIIRELVVVQDSFAQGEFNHDTFLCEVRGNNCRIGNIRVVGQAADWKGKQGWIDSCMSGVLISGNDNVIGQVGGDRLHVPLLATGGNNKIISQYASMISGDAFNLCGDNDHIFKAEYSDLLKVFDYEKYHCDVGMFYAKGGVISDCSVSNIEVWKSSHKWAGNRQGILSDGVAVNCNVYNFRSHEKLNPEHGVSHADGFYCEVMNSDNHAAINWDKKSVGSCDHRGNIYVGVMS